ncbi:MAG: hypothetical protein J7L04_02480 [Bacteroidales bacterium]|nr:hypothetical protein [Bacteroidales bacterium]
MKNVKKKNVLVLFFMVLGFAMNLHAQKLLIGTAETDITPTLPVALVGQFHLRIADTVETPLTANVVALESRDENNSLDIAIMVSCDVVFIPVVYTKMVRDEVKKQLPDLDVRKIFLNATHTHTAPVLSNDSNSTFLYPIPKEGVLQVEEYRAFFVQQVTVAIVNAWKSRMPGSVTWGLGHASIANNRRVVYSKKALDPGPFGNKTAKMYGKSNSPDFNNLEGMAEDDVNMLFFWDKRGKLIAITIDVPCPAQEVEGRLAVNADYWHPVREKLKKRFGKDLCILGWIGVAGDQSPHIIYRRSAEERMRKLRNLSRLEEIARRIVLAVEETYEAVKYEGLTDVQLTHKVETLNLPTFIISENEYLFAKAERDKYAAIIDADLNEAEKVLTRKTWNADVVKRYEMQQKDPSVLETEVHILRIGDIVICTNPFELFTDFGIAMQARSRALQTFTIQLVGSGHYVPTEKAVIGGGYSAIPQSCPLGPEGGQILVDRTVDLINEIFTVNK